MGSPKISCATRIELLFKAIAIECDLPAGAVVRKGETSLSEMRTRPDFAVWLRGALNGFIEVKAPGKGADPRRWKAGHDKEQWDKLKALPNLLYTDGNGFSLWRDGALYGSIVTLESGIADAGSRLSAPPAFHPLISEFLSWIPIAPKGANELARVSARA